MPHISNVSRTQYIAPQEQQRTSQQPSVKHGSHTITLRDYQNVEKIFLQLKNTHLNPEQSRSTSKPRQVESKPVQPHSAQRKQSPVQQPAQTLLQGKIFGVPFSFTRNPGPQTVQQTARTQPQQEPKPAKPEKAAAHWRRDGAY